jgi:hypothetical protein
MSFVTQKRLFILSLVCLIATGAGFLFISTDDGPKSIQRGIASSEFKPSIPNSCLQDYPKKFDYYSIFYYGQDKLPEGYPKNAHFLTSGIYHMVRLEYMHERCIPHLDRLSDFSKEFFFLNKGEKATFSYRASAQRAYCGTQPEKVDSCPYDYESLQKKRFIIARVDQENYPEELEEIMPYLQDSSIMPHRKDLRFSENFGVIALERPHFQIPERPVRAAVVGSNRSGVFVDQGEHIVQDGIISYVYLKEKATPEEVIVQRITPELREEIFKTAMNRARVSVFTFSEFKQATEIRKKVESWAEALETYWKKSLSLLDQSDTPVTMSKRLDEFKPFNFEIDDSKRLARFVEEYTETLMQASSKALFSAKNLNELHSAASFWWSGRALQINQGCDNQNNQPYRDRKQLVLKQYEHQTCRRLATKNAFMNLNWLLGEVNGTIKLDSMEWLSIQALGSRQERVRLFIESFELMNKQILNGQLPGTNELSLILNQFIQIKEELKRQQVLTWLGLNPTVSADITTFHSFYKSLSLFLQLAASDTLSNIDGNHDDKTIEFRANLKKIWLLTQKELNLSPWPHKD